MEIIVSCGMGIVGSWIIARLFALGERANRRVAVGYFVSPVYRLKVDRQCRSEFSANVAMVKGVSQ